MLRRRAAPTPRPSPEPRHVVCALADRRFAVPVERILDVARLTTYTPLPCEDTANLGVVIHRGRVVPLVDLAPRLGVRRSGPQEPTGLCLFVMTGRGELGVPVDQVSGVTPAAAGGLPAGVALLDPEGWGGADGQGAAG